MKTKIILYLFLCFAFNRGMAQDIKESNLRFIEVTGSAEMEVQPDEIRFQIRIGEYFKEEYDKGKTEKDYVTKVPLEDIEKSLLKELTAIGITKEQMIISDVSSESYWLADAKMFRKSKTIEIVITDFKKMADIISSVKTKGIKDMGISELKNKRITEYRKEVKMQAMKAAKEKADYLLQSVGENIGKLLSATELDNTNNYFWQPQNALSNSIMPSQQSGSEDKENMRKIKLKYEIRARFEIK
ncbi:MAG TPA: SIMPL domain-containing protein [Saprospiraceae bacterium]|nr:SIMPL domain-containing protein [Saprospiraceae bacterium]